MKSTVGSGEVEIVTTSPSSFLFGSVTLFITDIRQVASEGRTISRSLGSVSSSMPEMAKSFVG